MFEPIPKPEKRIKEPKPLQRKTELRSFKVDKNGIPILSPPRVRKQKKRNLPAESPAAFEAQMKRKALRPKIDFEWVHTRDLWFEFNPPDYRGFYQCGLCPWEVHKDEVTLDHIIPKGSHPELKHVLSNLQAAHGVCNQRKGSRSMEAYERIYGPGGAWLAAQI